MRGIAESSTSVLTFDLPTPCPLFDVSTLVSNEHFLDEHAPVPPFENYLTELHSSLQAGPMV